VKPVINAAIAETIVITYRDVKNGSNKDNPIPHFPLPSQYVSVVTIFGLLAFLPERADRVGSLIGWGLVVATVLNLWTPGGQVKLATVESQGPAVPAPSSATSSTKKSSTSPLTMLGRTIHAMPGFNLLP